MTSGMTRTVDAIALRMPDSQPGTQVRCQHRAPAQYIQPRLEGRHAPQATTDSVRNALISHNRCSQ
jgi:hypothetical protein